jgi:hypothetical protein
MNPRIIMIHFDHKAIALHKKYIYWGPPTKDGKYRPNDMDLAFTNCQIKEIFQGNGKYTPIVKDIY